MQKKEDFVLTGIAVVIIALAIVSGGCQRASSPSTSPANSSTPTVQQLALIDDLRKLVATQCRAKAEAIDLDAPLVTQGCDELDVVELIMTVEEKYKITIPDIEGERVTLNSLARAVNNR